jgi:hypothetical protein
MKQATKVTSEKKPVVTTPTEFGLKLTVKCAKNSVNNLASFVKPLIDGTVAAFQQHDRSNEQKVAELLAYKYLRELNLKIPEVLALINRNDNALFGVRKLFWLDLKNERLQICPDDDYCNAGEIVFKENNDEIIEILGEVFEVNAIVLPLPER